MEKSVNLPQITQLESVRAGIQTLGIQNPCRGSDPNYYSASSVELGRAWGKGHSPGEIHTRPSEFCW